MRVTRFYSKTRPLDSNQCIDKLKVAGHDALVLTHSMRPVVVPKIRFCFHQSYQHFTRLIHELLNHYQACLYLFECIFHCDSKCSKKFNNVTFSVNLRTVVCSSLSCDKVLKDCLLDHKKGLSQKLLAKKLSAVRFIYF